MPVASSLSFLFYRRFVSFRSVLFRFESREDIIWFDDLTLTSRASSCWLRPSCHPCLDSAVLQL